MNEGGSPKAKQWASRHSVCAPSVHPLLPEGNPAGPLLGPPRGRDATSFGLLPFLLPFHVSFHHERWRNLYPTSREAHIWASKCQIHSWLLAAFHVKCKTSASAHKLCAVNSCHLQQNLAFVCKARAGASPRGFLELLSKLLPPTNCSLPRILLHPCLDDAAFGFQQGHLFFSPCCRSHLFSSKAHIVSSNYTSIGYLFFVLYPSVI